MSNLLLDTTIFIDYYRGDPGALEVMEEVFQERLRASFSPISILELWLVNMSVEEENVYRRILPYLEEAPLTRPIALRAAESLRSLELSLREAMIRDALIAATASERGEPVCTRNTRDFQRLGVSIRPY